MNLCMYEGVKNVFRLSIYAKDKIELINFNVIMYRKVHDSSLNPLLELIL